MLHAWLRPVVRGKDWLAEASASQSSAIDQVRSSADRAASVRTSYGDSEQFRSHLHCVLQVLRLPMSFFDSQPAGRLLNRFSQDTESTDVAVRETIAWCLTCVGGNAFHICLRYEM